MAPFLTRSCAKFAGKCWGATGSVVCSPKRKKLENRPPLPVERYSKAFRPAKSPASRGRLLHNGPIYRSPAALWKSPAYFLVDERMSRRPACVGRTEQADHCNNLYFDSPTSTISTLEGSQVLSCSNDIDHPAEPWGNGWTRMN